MRDRYRFSPAARVLALPLLLIAVPVVALAGSQPAPPAGKSTEPAAGTEAREARKAAPKLELVDLAGKKQRLSDLRGKIVVLNFWASWCMPCRKEMPVLVKLQGSHGKAGVQVIGASAEGTELADTVKKFSTETGLNFPVWLGATPEHMERFGLAPWLPMTALIDREGRIADRIQGMVEDTALRARVDALLAEKAED